MGATTQEFRSVPVINVAPLVLDAARAAANEGAAAAQGDAMPEDVAAVVAQIGQACRCAPHGRHLAAATHTHK